MATTIIQPDTETRVVFLGGVQRSGTNMIMDILDRSPDTEVYHERDPRAYHNFQLKEQGVIRHLARSRSPCVIFKTLCDNDRLATLMSEFSRTSAIWVYRHFDEVVASHLAIRSWGRNQIDDLVHDRMAAGWRGRGMTDETWETVKRHYHSDLSRASAIALFWFYRNQLFFDQKLDVDPRVYMIKYAEFLSDPPAEVLKLAAFLDIRTTSRMVRYPHWRFIRRRRVMSIDQTIRELCGTMFRRLELAKLQGPSC